MKNNVRRSTSQAKRGPDLDKRVRFQPGERITGAFRNALVPGICWRGVQVRMPFDVHPQVREQLPGSRVFPLSCCPEKMKTLPPIGSAQVSASRNTSQFGLWLGSPLRDAWVTPGACAASLELEAGPTVAVRLGEGFWNQCPEFRHPCLEEWWRDQGLTLPWPDREPWKFQMERISGTRFRVRRRPQSWILPPP